MERRRTLVLASRKRKRPKSPKGQRIAQCFIELRLECSRSCWVTKSGRGYRSPKASPVRGCFGDTARRCALTRRGYRIGLMLMGKGQRHCKPDKRYQSLLTSSPTVLGLENWRTPKSFASSETRLSAVNGLGRREFRGYARSDDEDQEFSKRRV